MLHTHTETVTLRESIIPARILIQKAASVCHIGSLGAYLFYDLV